MHAGGRGLEIEFDFIDHLLELRTTNGEAGQILLEPQSVATFYRSTMAALDGLGLHIHVDPRPSEVVEAIPFDVDETHRTHDRDAVHRFWHALVHVDRVLTEFRSRFIGKASPVHLFWGGTDLCTTRFSGRPAPKHRGGVPNCPDSVQVLAYTHEVSSAGFWPGGDVAMFYAYAYAYPEPDGFSDWPVEPAGANYNDQLGEYVLPHSVAQTAPDSDATLLAFLQSTYEAAAELGHWDRAALEWASVSTDQQNQGRPMTQTPDAVAQYQEAHDRRDVERALAAFTPNATVKDDGHEYHGRGEIRDWLARASTQFTYTRTLTGANALVANTWLVTNHLEGDFPGGASTCATASCWPTTSSPNSRSPPERCNLRETRLRG
jgi:hypothetical protein